MSEKDEPAPKDDSFQEDENQPTSQYDQLTSFADKLDLKLRDQNAKNNSQLGPLKQHEIDVNGEKIIYRRRGIRAGERTVLEGLRSTLLNEVRRGSKHS